MGNWTSSVSEPPHHVTKAIGEQIMSNGLTNKKLVSVLQNLQQIVEDKWNYFQQVMPDTGSGLLIEMGGLSNNAVHR